MNKARSINFDLPPKGLFQKTNESDPLPYYYMPFIGRLYHQRIQRGLRLLDNKKYNSILEFGYGNGLLLPSLNKLSPDVSGVDLFTEPKGVYESLKKVNSKAKLYKEDLRKIKFDNNSFSLIVAFSVFEHIKDYDTILAEMYRILEPGGQLLIGMPRVDKFMNLFFRFIGFKGIEKHHVTNYKEILTCANEQFEITKLSRYPFNSNFFPVLYYNFLLTKKF